MWCEGWARAVNARAQTRTRHATLKRWRERACPSLLVLAVCSVLDQLRRPPVCFCFVRRGTPPRNSSDHVRHVRSGSGGTACRAREIDGVDL
ncbi:hypothetical protein BDA96_09G250400 [Sorghum bicolor]|jgi:hypothetical protein|uniref:Uncharacterized protein n=2 Tax=Sorghum bicolor TaxID=4558 RepID=A0A921QDU5_SORBI|nr:hypothetical protein BDA96_09G250400 [Sorghum bicolor]KXG22554.1 hypothetical protein SORBI_3009G236900 [Sorghum bicolor]